MSQAENKVKWCLNKAKKELEENKKHRGLIEKKTDIGDARKHIEKAEHNLKAISYFNEGGFSDWSMSAVFYCIYQCFLAIASKFGYESRNQECTIALMRYLKEQNKIEMDNEFIDALESTDEQARHETNIIEKREFYTYGTTISVRNKEIEEAIELCKKCLHETQDIVFEIDTK
ncbi:HEPN domain-containing protein [Candidatus Pacearchaeota archaeon]|nr:HEPN domain-containing protein [Candidatus Pacearchaeota archaeon]